MTPKQLRRHFEREGFWLKRDGGKHLLWTDGITTIPMSKGSKQSSVNVRNQLAEIRRAILKREKSEANRVLSVTLREMKDNVREPEKRLAPITATEIQKFNAIKEPVANGHAATFEVAEDPKAKRAKYDAVSRRRLERAIEDLYNSGMHDHRDMILDLIKMGHKDPDGTQLKPARVRHYLQVGIESGNIKQALVPPKTTLPPVTRQAKPGVLPDTVMAILTDPGLSAEQKVRMTLAYAEL